MSTVVKAEVETMEDLLARLGGIPPYRVLMRPTPGEATEADLLDHVKRTKRICELVDGTLVEKAMGKGQSGIACHLIMYLAGYILPRKLGFVTTEAGMTRFREGVVLAPDISFFRRDKSPNRQIDMTPIGESIPDLAVEVISSDNTKAEIDRKIGEYFLAGVEAVWVLDPFRRVVVVHTSPDDSVTLAETDTLEGGTVFPGLDLPLARIFEEVPPTRRRNRRKKT